MNKKVRTYDMKSKLAMNIMLDTLFMVERILKDDTAYYAYVNVRYDNKNKDYVIYCIDLERAVT